MRLAAQLEFVLAKTQSVQQYPIIEYFRARQIGSCDVDVVDSYHFGHGAVCVRNYRAGLELNSPAPICGAAALVCDREYAQLVIGYGVNDRVWKAWHDELAPVLSPQGTQ